MSPSVLGDRLSMVTPWKGLFLRNLERVQWQKRILDIAIDLDSQRGRGPVDKRVRIHLQERAEKIK